MVLTQWETLCGLFFAFFEKIVVPILTSGGYVGLSIATLLSQHHHVTAVDIIPEKVEMINNRKSPIQDDYIEKYLAEKDLDLTATLDAKAALRESAAAEAAGLYRLGDAALDICKRSRAKFTDAAGTAVCGPLAGNAGKECGAAALGRCWYRQEFYGGLHCQCPDRAGSSSLHDEFCPNHE